MVNKVKFKYILTILSILFCISVNASDFKQIKYKNIKEGDKILYTNSSWSTKIPRKNNDFFVKQKLLGTENFTEYYSPQNNISFSTGTQYEFIKKGKLYGYSNYEMKFFEFDIKNNLISAKELDEYEVRTLFPERKQVKISDFKQSTNSYKIKKHLGKLKLIVLNDTDNYFYNYGFSTNNSKIQNYELKGFIDVTKKGMIQLSRFGENSKNSPWYILLVR